MSNHGSINHRPGRGKQLIICGTTIRPISRPIVFQFRDEKIKARVFDFRKTLETRVIFRLRIISRSISPTSMLMTCRPRIWNLYRHDKDELDSEQIPKYLSMSDNKLIHKRLMRQANDNGARTRYKKKILSIDKVESFLRAWDLQATLTKIKVHIILIYEKLIIVLLSSSR